MTRLGVGLAAAAILILPLPSGAETRPRTIAQYSHQRWSAESDPPLPIFSLAQGPDGFIWVGAGLSVYRFDGLSFEPVEVEGLEGPYGSPSAMLTTSTGEIWTVSAPGGVFAVYRDGRLQRVPAPDPGGSVTTMAEGRDGAVWAGMGEAGRGLMRYRAGTWTRFDAAAGLPNDQLLDLVVAADGAVWVSYIHSVMRLPPGRSRFQTVIRTPEARSRIARDGEGRIWLSDKIGIRPITGAGGVGRPPALRHPYRSGDGVLRGRIRFDRRGDLWIMTRTGGVRRIAQPDPSGARTAVEANAAAETLDVARGLTSNIVNDMLEDHEGNVWFGTEGGLDRFRAASFRKEPILTSPAPFGDVLFAASDGSVYVGAAETLFRIPPGGGPEALFGTASPPEVICEAPDGAIWIGFGDRIEAWRNGRRRRMASMPTTDSGFYDCAFDQRGAFWATAGGSGMFRFDGGKMAPMFGAPDQTAFHPTIMQRDQRGALVIHWAPGLLAWQGEAGRATRQIDPGNPRPQLRTLHVDSANAVIGAGSFGLARFGPGRTSTIAPERFEAAERIRGVAQGPDGYTWLASQLALFRIRTADLDRAFRDPGYTPPSLKLDGDDGLTARIGPQSARPMVRGGDGRLWLATRDGTIWLDPSRLIRNPVQPRISVSAVLADGVSRRDPTSLRFPAGTTDIRLSFSVLSFANPKANAVRYRLEGYDRDWIDPGLRREAFYTNLRPGQYRFHVTGANNEGVWNEAGDVVTFEIEPKFVQTAWFWLLCGGGGLLLLWFLHRMRLDQASATIRNRLEERMHERERIARELHDTLLQGVQGLILRFQSAKDRLPPRDAARLQLEAALARADEIVAEGRDTLRDLRDGDGTNDLRTRIQLIAFDPPCDAPQAELVVEGEPCAVEPLVGAEIARIVREALVNVGRHARASSVTVVLAYEAQQVRVEVHDDGVGIPPAIMAAGSKPGHYGLIGMRERADRIGAALSLGSTGQGASIVLVVPGRLAYSGGSLRGPARPRPFWRSRAHIQGRAGT